MPKIDVAKCVGCGTCVLDCQPGVVQIVDGKSSVKPETNCLECGHCVAVCPQNAVTIDGYDLSEIMEYDPELFDISPENLLNFVRFRRSVRQFTDEAVSDEDIAKIIEMGRYTQTGANMQPLRFIVVSKETMPKVAKIANETLANFDLSTVDFSTIRLSPLYARFQGIWQAWNAIYQKTGKELLLHGAPHHLLVVTYKGNEIDASLSISNMELMIHALGLGACCTGFGTLAYTLSPELREIVGVQDNETVAFSMTFGHPKVQYHRTTNRRKANYTKV